MSPHQELYLRPVFEPSSDPARPLQRIQAVEIIDQNEDVVGELPVTHVTIAADGNDFGNLTLSTYRFIL